jgi:hypothetical protein
MAEDTEIDTTVEDENKEETKKQVENKDQFIEDTGQLTEDPQGDYQRRVQLGVNPNEIGLANPDAAPDENKHEAEEQAETDDGEGDKDE